MKPAAQYKTVPVRLSLDVVFLLTLGTIINSAFENA